MSNNYLLFINTLHPESAEVALVLKTGSVARKELGLAGASESFHAVLESLLAAANLRLADTSGIIVATGEGTFTGQRVGLAWANALAFALTLPEATIKAGNIPSDLQQLWNVELKKKSLLASYSSKPHITKGKNRHLQALRKRKSNKRT